MTYIYLLTPMYSHASCLSCLGYLNTQPTDKLGHYLQAYRAQQLVEFAGSVDALLSGNLVLAPRWL